MIPVRAGRIAAFLVAALGLPLAAFAANEKYATIYFKDGFSIRGYVKQEGTTVLDRTGDKPVIEWIPRGFIYIDDGARNIIFNPLQVSEGGVIPEKPETDWDVTYDIKQTYVGANRVPPILGISETTPWDDKWIRKIKFKSIVQGRYQDYPAIPQHLFKLTPEYARADSASIHYNWSAYYLTRELGPDQVRALFGQHKDLKEARELAPAEVVNRRFRLFHFFVAAGWLDEAEYDLNRILNDFPDQKDKVEEARKVLQRLQALQLYDELKLAHHAGQHQEVLRKLPKFPDSGLPDKMHADIRTLQSAYDKAQEDLKLARRYLTELPGQVSSPHQKQFFQEATAAIRAELHLDDFLRPAADPRWKPRNDGVAGRLDAFLTQARQAERQQKQTGKPEMTPAQLLALAVSGWLLGSQTVVSRPEVAEQLWLARQLVLEHHRTADYTTRKAILEKWQKAQSQRNPSVTVEEFAQMLPYLPPPDPPKEFILSPVEHTAQSPRLNRGVSYWAQLPPEYHPGRAYPVLIVLHDSGETAKEVIYRWNTQAARNGFIVAAPQCRHTLDIPYGYTEDEHAAVLDLLRDLRRHYQIDSDRVFLTGKGNGGNMAYDVAMSHPDLFAGVLPMCGMPGLFGERPYLLNAQYLPFYAMAGDHCGNIHQKNRELYRNWIAKGYPAIYIEYKGRGLEWFAAEPLLAFDWMNRKVRFNPFLANEAGAPEREFRTLRAGDNRFYWLSTDDISSRNLMPEKWNPYVIEARMYGQVLDGNRINVSCYGLRQVSVWFGRGGKIALDKPVMVSVNLRERWGKPVKPDLATLLEDLCQRGDRQRPCLARLDFDLR